MKKIALLFPGLGSQYVGMGKKLYEKSNIAKLVFEEANDILGFDLTGLCFKGGLYELSKPEKVQPAIVVASVAAYRVYMHEFGILPICAAGHSLGEYSALICSGALDFCDGLKIVEHRGRLMSSIDGAMTVIDGVTELIAEETCKRLVEKGHDVFIACYNSPTQVMLSGSKNSILDAEDEFAECGAIITPIMDSIPAHCPLMQPAAIKLKEILEKTAYREFEFPIVSNVHAKPYYGTSTVSSNLANQMVNSVQWHRSIQYILEEQIDIFVEMGPKTVLRDLTLSINKGAEALSSDNSTDMDKLKKLSLNSYGQDSYVASEQIPVNSSTIIAKCLAIAVCTKNRGSDEDEYRKRVIDPYKKVKDMHLSLEAQGKKPSEQHVKEAYNMLLSVFKAKNTPAVEQSRRINSLVGLGLKSFIYDMEL